MLIQLCHALADESLVLIWKRRQVSVYTVCGIHVTSMVPGVTPGVAVIPCGWYPARILVSRTAGPTAVPMANRTSTSCSRWNVNPVSV